jgi:hypothetical protein
MLESTDLGESSGEVEGKILSTSKSQTSPFDSVVGTFLKGFHAEWSRKSTSLVEPTVDEEKDELEPDRFRNEVSSRRCVLVIFRGGIGVMIFRLGGRIPSMERWRRR